MDEQLTSLIREARQQASYSKQRQKTLNKIVDEILRSRKICRLPRGQSLYGIYQEIYQEVRKQLLHDVAQALQNYNQQRTSVREWANTLRDNAFRKVINDARLQTLALTVQKSNFQTEERHYALRELIEAIRLSGRLCRPHLNKIPTYFYNLIYEEAVNQTLLYVCQKINNYDPKKGQTGSLMTWVNFRLDKLVIETWHNFYNPNQLLSNEELDNLLLTKETPSLFEKIWECLEEDTENLFKRKYIKGHRDAHFQAIALARMSGKSWAEISEEFGGIKIAALSNFFQRNCRRFAAKFKECL